MDQIIQNVGQNAGLSQQQTSLLKGGTRAAAKGLLPIGEEEEIAYGGAVAVMIVQRYGGLYRDPKVMDYVNKVGQTVAAYSDRPDLAYHFAILDSNEVNALSAPGGYVFLTRGALQKMANEAELAGVLAHEVAHIAQRHSLEIIRQLKAKDELLKAAAEAWKAPEAFSKLMDRFLADYLEKGLPQEDEHEADRLGTECLLRLGYRPDSLQAFLETMRASQAQEEARHRFFKTHPDTSQRIAHLDKQLAQAGDPGGRTLETRFLSGAR
jgi:predicted Zn-dependent protease